MEREAAAAGDAASPPTEPCNALGDKAGDPGPLALPCPGNEGRAYVGRGLASGRVHKGETGALLPPEPGSSAGG